MKIDLFLKSMENLGLTIKKTVPNLDDVIAVKVQGPMIESLPLLLIKFWNSHSKSKEKHYFPIFYFES